MYMYVMCIHMCKYIYIYIYTHTYIHTYIHTNIHTYIHSLVNNAPLAKYSSQSCLHVRQLRPISELRFCISEGLTRA